MKESFTCPGKLISGPFVNIDRTITKEAWLNPKRIRGQRRMICHRENGTGRPLENAAADASSLDFGGASDLV
jgi:hypothetical protein